MKVDAYKIETTKAYHMSETGTSYTFGPAEDYKDRNYEQSVHPVTAVVPNNATIYMAADGEKRMDYTRPDGTKVCGMTLQEALTAKVASIIKA